MTTTLLPSPTEVEYLVATEVEYLPVCGACGGRAERLKRLGGIGRPLCPNCYQRAKRAAYAAQEALGTASRRVTIQDLYGALVGAGLGRRTIQQYMRAIWRAEEWFEAQGWSLARATPTQIAAFADTLPLTHSTRTILRASLRHYWTVSEHPKPPTAAIRVPPQEAMICRALDDDDARTLAAAARSHGGREGFAVLLGLYQALRREEIASMTWRGFEQVEGCMKIFGKGAKTRTIPVHPVVDQALRGLPRSGEWIFAGKSRGTHVSPATIWQWTRDLATSAGLPPIRTHWLRHTGLATMNDATGDLRTVQAFAGHSKPETTAGYTRATKRKLLEAVLSLDY